MHNTKFTGFVLIFAVFLMSQAAQAATYYLDAVNGNDNNPGTSAQPWKTLAKAKATVSAGDTVNLKAGNYGTVSWGNSDTYGTSWDSPITYQSDPLKASYGASITQITINREGAANPNCYLVFSGVDVNVPGEHATPYGIGIINANHVKVLNSRVRGVWGGGSGENPSLVYIQSSEDIIIQDCNIYNGGLDGVIIYSSKDVTVRNCLVHDIMQSGIRLGGNIDNIVIEYNRVYDGRGNWSHDPRHQGGSGIDIRSHHATIRGNIVWGSWGTRTICVYPAVKPDWSDDPNGWHDLTFENNITYQGGNWTEFNSVNQNWIIRNNTFGEFVQIRLARNSNGFGLTLYNNIFAGNFELDSFSNTTSSPRDSNWANVNEGRNMYNQLASQGNGYVWLYDEFKPGSDSICIHDATGNYKSGYDSTYFDIGKFFASKSGEWPYMLSETSPAIGLANKNYTPLADIMGNQRDAQPDAGAYEYAPSTFLYGDISGDSEITAFDAALAAHIAVGLSHPDIKSTAAAEVSGDGKVTAYDAALIAQFAAGLIEKFPVEQ